jgi:hypothetical protein
MLFTILLTWVARFKSHTNTDLVKIAIIFEHFFYFLSNLEKLESSTYENSPLSQQHFVAPYQYPEQVLDITQFSNVEDLEGFSAPPTAAGNGLRSPASKIEMVPGPGGEWNKDRPVIKSEWI